MPTTEEYARLNTDLILVDGTMMRMESFVDDKMPWCTLTACLPHNGSKLIGDIFSCRALADGGCMLAVRHALTSRSSNFESLGSALTTILHVDLSILASRCTMYRYLL